MVSKLVPIVKGRVLLDACWHTSINTYLCWYNWKDTFDSNPEQWYPDEPDCESRPNEVFNPFWKDIKERGLEWNIAMHGFIEAVKKEVVKPDLEKWLADRKSKAGGKWWHYRLTTKQNEDDWFAEGWEEDGLWVHHEQDIQGLPYGVLQFLKGATRVLEVDGCEIPEEKDS